MEYDIYEEWYICLGGEAKARYVGTYKGNSFEEACQNYVIDKNLGKLYNKKNNTVYGCRLYQTLEEAAKTFG